MGFDSCVSPDQILIVAFQSIIPDGVESLFCLHGECCAVAESDSFMNEPKVAFFGGGEAEGP